MRENGARDVRTEEREARKRLMGEEEKRKERKRVGPQILTLTSPRACLEQTFQDYQIEYQLFTSIDR